MDAIFIFLIIFLPCMCYYEYDDDSYTLTKVLKSPYARRRQHDIEGVYDEYERYDYRSPWNWLRKQDKPEKSKKKKRKKKPTKPKTAPTAGTTIYTNLPEKPSLKNTVFSKLKNEQKRATVATAQTYPWIARVVHSREINEPYLCTAACIQERIFVTAAACIYQAKVYLTTVIHNDARLESMAFVFPSKHSKTMFDDIGFIIVKKRSHKWNTVKVFDKNDDKKFIRTDDYFFWFANMIKASSVYGDQIEGKVVGYVGNQLYETTVYASPFLCQHFYNTDMLRNANFKSNNYFVPCYHTCTLRQGYNKLECNKRLAGEGHIMIEKKTNKLIGIATWAGYTRASFFLPVGMAMPNSKNFLEDLQCARKIAAAPDNTKPPFAALCK